MGNLWSTDTPSTRNYDPLDVSPLEVYILYKVIGKEKYTSDSFNSHHICLFRTSDGRFYYTDLQTEDGGSSNALCGLGKIKLRFGEYTFHKTNGNYSIYYHPVGRTTRTLREIKTFIDTHDTANTVYHLFKNNCQHYVTSIIKYLDLQYPSWFDVIKLTNNSTNFDITIKKI